MNDGDVAHHLEQGQAYIDDLMEQVKVAHQLVQQFTESLENRELSEMDVLRTHLMVQRWVLQGDIADAKLKTALVNQCLLIIAERVTRLEERVARLEERLIAAVTKRRSDG